jgi:hypothetical protein
MPAGSPLAFTLLRVPRGAQRPSEEAFRVAIARDREQLGLPVGTGPTDLEIAGPYPVVVDGTDLDEYTAWER